MDSPKGFDDREKGIKLAEKWGTKDNVPALIKMLHLPADKGNLSSGRIAQVNHQYQNGSGKYQDLMKRLAAEGFGTFALVFAGTAAIVVNEASTERRHPRRRGSHFRPDRPGHDLRGGRGLRGASEPGGDAGLFPGPAVSRRVRSCPTS